MQKERPERFLFVKGRAKGFFFSYLAFGGQVGVGIVFGGGCTTSACHGHGQFYSPVTIYKQALKFCSSCTTRNSILKISITLLSNACHKKVYISP